jgi:hypothetical protein
MNNNLPRETFKIFYRTVMSKGELGPPCSSRKESLQMVNLRHGLKDFTYVYQTGSPNLKQTAIWRD